MNTKNLEDLLSFGSTECTSLYNSNANMRWERVTVAFLTPLSFCDFQVSNSINFIPEFMTNVSHLLLPHLFQRALLENKSESLDLVENIWSQVCELCPLQRLLLAGCPVYGSWFALIQKPSNHPLPGKLSFLNQFSTKSRFIYIYSNSNCKTVSVKAIELSLVL